MLLMHLNAFSRKVAHFPLARLGLGSHKADFTSSAGMEKMMMRRAAETLTS
jgi:hypothetical protein